MKSYIVSVKIKYKGCEVGVAKVFVRGSNAEFASNVALNFFSDKYECEVIGIGKFNTP